MLDQSEVTEFNMTGRQQKAKAQAQFPENLRFVAGDWAKDGLNDDEEGYDVIFA